MNNEALKYHISGSFADATFDETGEFFTVSVPAGSFFAMMEMLRFNENLHFDYLFCMTCVDWKDHLMMVYHLQSKTLQHALVVKCRIDDTAQPAIDSVNSLWKTAELNEDEIYDLFGVRFHGHPNLRRIFLQEDWKGYPLRKNYTDENMIRL